MPNDEDLPVDAPVVVGVDDGPAARAALLWAHEEARRLGAPLVAVSVMTGPAGGPDEAERRADDVLDRAVVDVLGDRAGDVRRLAIAGRPVPALLDVARGARLLVLGSPDVRRARDPWSSAVAALLPRQADCPVVLVPADDRRRRRGAGGDRP